MYAKGGYEFHLTSDNQNVDFSGLRFDIADGAEFHLNLAVGDFVSTATFTGVTGQVSFELSCQPEKTRLSQPTSRHSQHWGATRNIKVSSLPPTIFC